MSPNVIPPILLIRYSGEKATLPFLLNADLEKSFTIHQIVEKHAWHESLVLSVKFKAKNNIPEYLEYIRV